MERTDMNPIKWKDKKFKILRIKLMPKKKKAFKEACKKIYNKKMQEVIEDFVDNVIE